MWVKCNYLLSWLQAPGIHVLGRGNAASYPENQEWPFTAFFVCMCLALCVVCTCTGIDYSVRGQLHMIVGHCGLHYIAFGRCFALRVSGTETRLTVHCQLDITCLQCDCLSMLVVALLSHASNLFEQICPRRKMSIKL